MQSSIEQWSKREKIKLNCIYKRQSNENIQDKKNESLPLTRSIKGFVDYSIQRSSIAMTKWKRFEKKTCNKKGLYYC